MDSLIACEESQSVTIEFRKLGRSTYSNDILECSGGYPEWHIKDDVMHVLPSVFLSLKFLGFHPVCKFLANSGVRWLASKKPMKGYEWSDKYKIHINWDRYEKMKLAAMFFKSALSWVKSVGCGYVENPIMHSYAMELINEKPTQIVQPYQFGHLEKKATCLWIVGLPKLKETNNVYDDMMKLDYKEIAKVHYCSPGPERDKIRSKSYQGISEAMAVQWNNQF